MHDRNAGLTFDGSQHHAKHSMTLLITVVGHGFALSSSDTRISTQVGTTYKPVDEHFNKHIVFNSGELVANVTYTGPAQWKEAGRTVRMYDIISDSLSASVKKTLELGPLAAELATDLMRRLKGPSLSSTGKIPLTELHILGRHPKCPYPFIGVLSTFRTSRPWEEKHDLQWEFQLGDFNFYLAAANKPEMVIGGMDTAVRKSERDRLLAAVSAGADTFNTAKMCSKLIEIASTRSSSIGARSVAIVLPDVGLLDTDLFDRHGDKLVAFMPKMIFSNGSSLGPSEFPVDLSLLLDGHLSKHSLFFKAVVQQSYKTADRRRMFRSRKGRKIPGIMGILLLTLFGEVPNGYSDFGLSE